MITLLPNLSESQQELYVHSLEDLSDNAEDVAFRTYDLLFASYPTLKKSMNDDRYCHPDLTLLLTNDEQAVQKGLEAIASLNALICTSPQAKNRRFFFQVHKCLIQAIRDIMFIEASRDLVAVYAKLLDYRLRNDKLRG